MLKAHRKVEQFEGRSSFTTWISRIAINEALMCLRKKRGAVLLPLEEAMPPDEETLAGPPRPRPPCSIHRAETIPFIHSH
jgi:RNA polymerase sigma-70 factor, ECF subfamily